MGLFDFLGDPGAAAALGGFGQGVLRGQQQGAQQHQLQAMDQYRQAQLASLNQYRGAGLQMKKSLADEHIDEQQRQAAGRVADSIYRRLTDPQSQADLNRQPGLMGDLLNEYHTRRAVQAGTVDWRQAPPSKFADPITGEPLLDAAGAPQGADTGFRPTVTGRPGGGTSDTFTAPAPGTPGTPWVPEAGQSPVDNPYLSTKERQGQQRVDTGAAAQQDTATFHHGLLDHFNRQDVVAATRENAALIHQQFQDTLNQGEYLLKAGHLSFEEQQGVWAKLLSAGIQEKRAGGNPVDALKPLLTNRGQFGSTINGPAVTQYLTGHGYSPQEIRDVIQGFGGAGSGAKFDTPSGPAGGGAQAGAVGVPAASDLTPQEQAALSAGTSGIQTAVKGSFQNTDGPPVLPQAGTVQAASLPGGGPPTAAQVQSAGGGGGAGLQPFNPIAQGAGPGGVPLAPQGPGLPAPPPIRSLYPAGSYEDSIFRLYTGADGKNPLPVKFILDQARGNPDLLRRANDVIQNANSQQKAAQFGGAPVQDTLGARVPDVPEYGALQINMPGVGRLAPVQSSPLTLQGGFAGPSAPAPFGGMSGGGGGAGGIAAATPSGGASGGGGGVPQPAPSRSGNKGGGRLGKGETGVPLLDVHHGPAATEAPLDSTAPSSSVSGGMSRVPGTAPKVIPNSATGPGPAVSSKGSPEVSAITQQNLKKYRSLPYSAPIERFFRDRGITDPDRKESIYQWVTGGILPEMRRQYPQLGEKGVRANLYGTMQRYLPR